MLAARLPVSAVTTTIVAGALAAATLAPPVSAVASGFTTVQVPQRLCSTATPGQRSCDAVRLVTRRLSVAQATQLRADGLARPAGWQADLSYGPHGGYAPAQIATAYGFNVGGATTQTVAIVDAFDDPSALADLNAFDTNFGLPPETATSFRKVTQTGDATQAHMPLSSLSWASEITLDVQAVRGLCHACKILLVEATDNLNANLGTAANYAATHATIVTNSYGGPESDPGNTSAIQADYNHPGVAILASAGNEGWYSWDRLNVGGTSDSVPSSPAAYRTVIGIGGTSLYLKPDGTRAAEQVWNGNGPNDVDGIALAQYYGVTGGAAGSGCSTLFAPQLWQQKVAGYSTLGCGTHRNSVDLAAVADHFTGYDVYQTTTTWCSPGGMDGTGDTCPAGDAGWQTYGGTSLAAPVVAAMWALAGGPAGVRYPALSLYGHFKSDATHPLYDVTVGGTGACDTGTPSACSQTLGAANPNTLGYGLVDCMWGASTSATLANHYQCYARPGYDGVSGVGTPVGVNAFKPMSPRAVIKPPGTVTHGVSHTFSASGSNSPFPGGSIISYVWSWGDGSSTSTTAVTTNHKYATKGTKTITLTVKDNYTAQNNGRVGKKSITITVQ